MPFPAVGSARSASVTGAPSTSRIGVSIDSSMCAAMCMLNIAGMYRPTPDDVANSSTAQPSSQATVRPVGHASPRRRSRRTPARYSRGENDCGGAEDEVEPPVEQHPGHGRRAGEVVADRDLGGRRVEDRRRRRRRPAQPDRDTEGQPEHQRLDQRQPDQRAARIRVGLQGGDARCAAAATRSTPSAHSADDLGDDQPAVTVVEQIGRPDPHQGVDDAAERHRDEAPQGDGGEPARREIGVLAAAQRVNQQRQQTAGPQRAGDQVDQQAVGGQVVRAARRRVPGQRQRHQREQRSGEQQRRPATSAAPGCSRRSRSPPGTPSTARRPRCRPGRPPTRCPTG